MAEDTPKNPGPGEPQNTAPELPPLTIQPPQNTAPPSDAEWQPLPGEQFPAAVLPQSPYPAPPNTPPQGQEIPHPSGPLPTMPYAPPPPPRKPRNKTVITLAALAIVFFLAAGALGALWLVERGDHKATSSELQTVRDNLATTSKQLTDTEQARAKATTDKQRADRDAEAAKPCLDAAKAFVRAYSETEAEKAFDSMVMAC